MKFKVKSYLLVDMDVDLPGILNNGHSETLTYNYIVQRSLFHVYMDFSTYVRDTKTIGS